MLSDEVVKASPANVRAVLETVAALKKQGHECVEFKIPQRKSMGIYVSNVLQTIYLPSDACDGAVHFNHIS